MTNEETTAVPLSLAEIHYGRLPGSKIVDGCGAPGEWTAAWADVTCGACKLERPEDRTGRPEHFVPRDVAERDAGLVRADRVKRLERRLAETEAVVEMTRGTMNVWAARYGEACALREATVRELRSTVTDEKVSVVPEEGSGPFRASGTLSGGLLASWVSELAPISSVDI